MLVPLVLSSFFILNYPFSPFSNIYAVEPEEVIFEYTFGTSVKNDGYEKFTSKNVT